MKNSILILALSLSSAAISQTDELSIYQIDAQEPIATCDITAYVDSENASAGFIESIIGSIITLRIDEHTDYLIRVNNSKTFELNASNDLTKGHTLNQINEQDVVYRIQVGAFSESIPDSFYEYFKDIFVEKKPGTGISRLIIGNYYSLEKVRSAQEQIQNQGYSDAFIVAYYKGQRIDFSEALKKEIDSNQELSESQNSSDKTNIALSTEE